MRLALTTTVLRWVEVKPEAQRRVEKAAKQNLCVACMKPLDDTRTICGCHERCYRATMRCVARNETTIADEVAKGCFVLSTTRGGDALNPVTKRVRGIK